MTNKKTAIIQARMNSTRFPFKVLKKIDEQSILDYVIRQSLSSTKIDDIIIATTTNTSDNAIVDFCIQNNYKYFRGSEIDVLDRYYQCAKFHNLDPVIRITSDCPLIDPNVIDSIIDKFESNNYDYVSNNISFEKNHWIDSHCNFPQGMTVEISTFVALTKAWNEAKKPSEREHVFPYIQFHPNLFSITNVVYNSDLSKIRCTVDRHEDLEFVKEIVSRIPKEIPFITIKDIKNVIDTEPNLLDINTHISFDEGIKKSYNDDKKLGFT